MTEPKRYSIEWFRAQAKEAQAENEIKEAFRREKRGAKTVRGDPEHQLQKSLIDWFDEAFPELILDLYAVPNGGFRHKATAAKLKAEGVRAGVADLVLDKDGAFGPVLYMEVKVGKGKQSPNQKIFQKHVEEKGRKYIIIRSLEEFKKAVKTHLKR